MFKFHVVVCFFVVIVANVNHAQTYTISGIVRDSLSSERLPYASIQLNSDLLVSRSNAYGQFSLRVPTGKYMLRVSYVGYKPFFLSLDVIGDKSLELVLSQGEMNLNEFTVSDFSIVEDPVPGRNRISLEQILKQPSFAGEADVLKSIQFLPGVKSPSEATTNISVRGGSYDQTLILLDGAPVYNSSHALGFFSTFNPDAIKDVELYKGLIPARYGNRLSSVVDIRMKDGDMNKYQAKIGVGIIASRLTFEGPIKKGVSSFVSARATPYLLCEVRLRPLQ